MITFLFQLMIPVALMFFRFNRRPYFIARVIGFGVLFVFVITELLAVATSLAACIMNLSKPAKN